MEKETPSTSTTPPELPRELQLYIATSGDLNTIKKNIISFYTLNKTYRSLLQNPNTLGFMITQIANTTKFPLVYVSAHLAIDAPQWLHDGILMWLKEQWKDPATKNKIAQSALQTINTLYDRFTTNEEAIKLLTFLKMAEISLADINQSGIKQGNMLVLKSIRLPGKNELTDLNVDLLRKLLQLGIKYPLLQEHLVALHRKLSEVEQSRKTAILLRLINLLRSYKRFPHLYSPDVAKIIEENPLLKRIYEGV